MSNEARDRKSPTWTRQTGSNRSKLDTRQLHIPFTVFATCARCGGEVSEDLSRGAGLSYPKLATPLERSIPCKACGSMVKATIMLLLSLTGVTFPEDATTGEEDNE